MEWIHRGSWIGGMAVDVVAEDMTREGVTLRGDIDPDAQEEIHEAAESLGIWAATSDAIKWSRLYGGCIVVMMIDGHDYAQPLRLETVGRGQFRGLLVLDRWMVEPSLQNLVRAPGPHLGLPTYYTIHADAPALPRLKIHYSRCIRLEGIRLPYWQRLQENLWGISVLERLYDRMVAFDLTTTGAAQLVNKAHIRSVKINGLRDVIGIGGDAYQGFLKFTDMMRRFQNIEGLSILDKEDEFDVSASPGFGGLAEVLLQFGQQLSGALQIPLVRLFGQSPAGLNSSGESDLRTYYDGIRQRQKRDLGVGMMRVYRCIGQSLGHALPSGFGIEFRPLWQMPPREKADVAKAVAEAVIAAKDAGLVSDQVAMKELRGGSEETGVFSNISDEDINAANADIEPPAPELPPGGIHLPGSPKPGAAAAAAPPAVGGATQAAGGPADRGGSREFSGRPAGDSAAGPMLVHGLPVVIETARGEWRRGAHADGTPWAVRMAADYGYIHRTGSAEGAHEGMDCFIGDDRDGDTVWVINQRDLERDAFDEHKCMLGFRSVGDALGAYVDSYSDGRGMDRIMSIVPAPAPRFRDWLQTGNYTRPATAEDFAAPAVAPT